MDSQPVYDPIDPAFQRDIHEIYERLRNEAPVCRSADGAYVLTRYDDVRQAALDPGVFSSDHVAEASAHLPMLIYKDPPAHTSMRALISRAFTPRRVAALEPSIRLLAQGLLADWDDDFDLVSRFAAPLPSTVMAELIGVPVEQREEFRELTEAFVDIEASETLPGRLVRIHEMFAALLEQRRRQPQDDLMSALLEAEIDGVRLTEDELLGFCFLLLLAGNDTTTTLIGNGVALLAEHQEVRARVVKDSSLLPAAIEEMLRLESPTQALPRTAMTDVEIHGVRIPADSRVLLVWGAANLDEREFVEPRTFDIDRGSTRHLAFGQGLHHCIGSALARLEARVAFEVLLSIAPEYRLLDGRERYVSSWARAWRALPASRA